MPDPEMTFCAAEACAGAAATSYPAAKAAMATPALATADQRRLVKPVSVFRIILITSHPPVLTQWRAARPDARGFEWQRDLAFW